MGKAKEGNGIFAEDNLKLAEELKDYIGQYAKVVFKKSGLKVERKIDKALIQGVELGLFQKVTIKSYE